METPLQDELQQIYRLWMPEASHLIYGGNEAALCGLKRAEHEADLIISGETALELATCPSCCHLGARVVAAAVFEHLEHYGGSESLASIPAQRDAATTDRAVPAGSTSSYAGSAAQARELERLNEQSYYALKVSFAVALVLMLAGQPFAGLLVGVAGAVFRLLCCVFARPLRASSDS